MNRLQGHGEVDGDRGGAAAALGIHHGEDLSSGTFTPRLAAGRGQADESVEQVGGSGGTLNVFPDARPHGIDNQLRLRHGTDGEEDGFRHLLVQQFDGA
jgi:hypothetical protein